MLYRPTLGFDPRCVSTLRLADRAPRDFQVNNTTGAGVITNVLSQGCSLCVGQGVGVCTDFRPPSSTTRVICETDWFTQLIARAYSSNPSTGTINNQPTWLTSNDPTTATIIPGTYVGIPNSSGGCLYNSPYIGGLSPSWTFWANFMLQAGLGGSVQPFIVLDCTYPCAQVSVNGHFFNSVTGYPYTAPAFTPSMALAKIIIPPLFWSSLGYGTGYDLPEVDCFARFSYS